MNNLWELDISFPLSTLFRPGNSVYLEESLQMWKQTHFIKTQHISLWLFITLFPWQLPVWGDNSELARLKFLLVVRRQSCVTNYMESFKNDDTCVGNGKLRCCLKLKQCSATKVRQMPQLANKLTLALLKLWTFFLLYTYNKHVPKACSLTSTHCLFSTFYNFNSYFLSLAIISW